MGKQRQDEGARRETWQDWVPGVESLDESTLLSKDEVLVWAKELHLDLSEETFKDWREASVLPGPTITFRGRQRLSWYPWWTVDLIQHVRDYQNPDRPRGKLTLAEIAPRQRATAQGLAQRKPPRGKRPPWPPVIGEWPFTDVSQLPSWMKGLPFLDSENRPPVGAPSPRADSAYDRALRDYLMAGVTPSPPYDPTLAPQGLSDQIANNLWLAVAILASVYGQPYGLEIVGAELRLIDSYHRAIVFPISPRGGVQDATTPDIKGDENGT